MKSTALEKTQSPVSGSATLEIESAVQILPGVVLRYVYDANVQSKP